ncbi:CPBP family intramembrane glutamic endopeptidase [Cellulomonas rhizosphaerae]|uniref:CPBP family intramembrane metalloprotease n=1 Tax=Cellulomonas rhizosphaerae TaxID=2293719 RepID=A0A413RLG2_9CELL|nr:CPBP family intramembrane glutamic endopeptidase [Cellulomonas rhizosphaerae]RHA40765.1 CPBP family intramembrane metalloprotease [Cellulomonas rhizosphaerae]
MTEIETTSGWKAFWERGGFWRAVLLAVVYIALYLGFGVLDAALFGDNVDKDDLFSSAQSVAFGLLLPLVFGSILLAAFAASLGWFPQLFARQQIRGRGWMWLAPILVVAAVVLRLLGIDYGSYASGVVATTFVAGLFIGFAEELLTRGFAVKMLRDAGRSERAVMLLSSLIFALLHSTNVLSGQDIGVVAVTVVFAFAFGILMYLTLRATGNLIWPMLIHGLYDPTLFLASGGIDTTDGGSSNGFLTAAAPANFLFIVLAIVALFLVKGHREKTSA